MAGQVDKLEFLLASLIKMSRLETGTFALPLGGEPPQRDPGQGRGYCLGQGGRPRESPLPSTATTPSPSATTPKWTAEALGNILDNAVKYTPAGGQVTITVRPWQFYTRIDITDTGIGIPEGSITRSSSGSTGPRRWRTRRGWAWASTWPGASSPASGVTSV